jgi:hypothetical protein
MRTTPMTHGSIDVNASVRTSQASSFLQRVFGLFIIHCQTLDAKRLATETPC